MKIVIAPDSFKESMTALQAATAMEQGFREIFPDADIVKIPMADGGEGTVQALVDATAGEIVSAQVTGPLGEPVEAFYGLMGGGETAVIEMAAASGIQLVPKEKRNPLIATTRGTGELILAALNRGAKHIIIGIGGSATNDGGAGMAQALGARLLDAEGREIGFGGGELHRLASIDLGGLDARLKDVKIEAACDVDNPLIGPRGASAVFGPQKGATPEMIATLDRNLSHYADVIEQATGLQIKEIPGAGAAGGLGGGLLAFLSAELRRGVEIVLNAVRFEERVQDAALVVTGEGKIDSQTVYGKTPMGVAQAAKKFGIPVIGIAGAVSQDSGVVHEHGIDALFSIVPGIVTWTDALANAEAYIRQTARNIAAVWKLGR